MSILSDLGGGILSGAADIIGKFVADPNKAAEANLKLKQLVNAATSQKEETLRTTMRTRERVMVAELNQSDKFTKRARPTVVYFGLVVIAFNYCLVPLITLFMEGVEVTVFDLPAEFWVAWGGIVATWSIGRSAEYIGKNNKAVRIVTGSKKPKHDDFWDDLDGD